MMKTGNSHLKQHSLNSLWSPNMPKLLLSNAPVIWHRDQYFLIRLIIPKWEYFRNFKISSKWFFYVLPCSGPQLSRQNKNHGTTNFTHGKTELTYGKTKLTHGKTKLTHGKTKKTSWSAVVICIWNGTWCNSNQTKWRPLLLRIVEGWKRNQWQS